MTLQRYPVCAADGAVHNSSKQMRALTAAAADHSLWYEGCSQASTSRPVCCVLVEDCLSLLESCSMDNSISSAMSNQRARLVSRTLRLFNGFIVLGGYLLQFFHVDVAC